MLKVKKELENAEQHAAGTPLMRENEASVYWHCSHISVQGRNGRHCLDISHYP